MYCNVSIFHMKRRAMLALAGSTFFVGCVEEQPPVDVLSTDIAEQNCSSGEDTTEIEQMSNNEVLISGNIHSKWVSQEILVSPFTGSDNVNYVIIVIESISSDTACQQEFNSIHYNVKLRFDNMPSEIQVSHYVDGELSEGMVNQK